MPPRDTFGRSDKGPTRSTRTSAQIKKRGTAKAAASRLKARRKKRRDKKAREAAYKQRMAAQKIQAAEKAAAANKFREAEAQRANVAGAAAAQQAAARQAAQQAAARQAAASRSGAQTGRSYDTLGRAVPSRPRSPAPKSRSIPRVRPQPRPTGMSLSRFKAGLYNLLPESMRRAGPDTSGMTAKEKFDANPARQAFVRSRERRKKRRDRAADNVVPPIEVIGDPDRRPTDMPPEIIDDYDDYYDQFPTGPGYGGGMMGGLGGFGYSPALMAYESQQGAGQVPYYMAAARNAMTPNMSPAFMHAARNYDILGGMQRTRARPIEMMSARERAEIMNMGSNFNVPNYNSPYLQDQGARDFNYFRRMVSSGGAGQPADYAPIADMFPGGPPARFGGPGKGAPRPMSQGQARAMGAGLGSLMRSGMMGMF